jgi:hypothetical protein
VNEIGAAHAERSGALQNESAYRVLVFSENRLNRRRTHWPSHPVVVPDTATLALDPAL